MAKSTESKNETKGINKAKDVKDVKKAVVPQDKKIRKYPKEGTIGRVVLDHLAKNPTADTVEVDKIVRKSHPDSKFNKAHLAWYKHQIKVGNYILPTESKVKGKDKSKGKKEMAQASA